MGGMGGMGGMSGCAWRLACMAGMHGWPHLSLSPRMGEGGSDGFSEEAHAWDHMHGTNPHRAQGAHGAQGAHLFLSLLRLLGVRLEYAWSALGVRLLGVAHVRASTFKCFCPVLS